MADVAPLTILCIRHAEKPIAGGAHGIDASGRSDARSLTPRGWQRAGAWVQLFSPAFGGATCLPTPTAIFASDHGHDDDRSRRPVETVTALAAKISLTIDRRFTKGEEAALATAIQAMRGVVLICWQHEKINAILQALDNPPSGVPSHWPDHYFNPIYRLDRSGTGWSFTVAVPQLLNEDSDSLF